MKRTERKRGECSYCGNVAQLTVDHVIPRCLFYPHPHNTPKVYACAICNNAKSKDDDFLRDFLVTDPAVQGHPVAKSVLDEKVLSSVRRNSSVFWRDFASEVRLEATHSPGGVYLGDIYAGRLDGERVVRIFRRIVSGLYYRIRAQRIPQDYTCEVSKLVTGEFNNIWLALQRTGFNGPYCCGNVFTCIMQYTVEDPFVTAWWLWFYDSLCFHVRTEPSRRM